MISEERIERIAKVKLSPLASAYLSVVLAAQDAERELAASKKSSRIGTIDDQIVRPATPCGEIRYVEQDLPSPPLSADEILNLATERGLAEIVHLTTMPASRSTKIPLAWDDRQPMYGAPLEPLTGANNALRAVSAHVPRKPLV